MSKLKDTVQNNCQNLNLSNEESNDNSFKNQIDQIKLLKIVRELSEQEKNNFYKILEKKLCY